MDYMDSMIVNPNTKPTKYYSTAVDPRITQSDLALIDNLSTSININMQIIIKITKEYNHIYAQFQKTETEPQKRTLYNQMTTLSSEKNKLILKNRKFQSALDGIRKAQHDNNYDLLGTDPDLIPMSDKNVSFENIGGTKKRRRIKTKRRKKSNKKKRNNRTYRR